ncbi:NUDIX hydrolase [Paenibacillus glycinis]|uniref:NUDIX hydrolase n=1 Tax=Paenibacillus glycinis TaxID=2697035 RepID=UPI002E2BCCE0|nr:NUDIX hydrolase [Paenibacillus glycinis]
MYDRPNSLLMVRQYVERGDIVWNFPGGGIEDGESPEQACVREVAEETGFQIKIIELISKKKEKYTYRAEIIGGTLKTEFNEPYNEDIIEVQWIDMKDANYFDKITKPIRDEFIRRIE